MLRSAQRDALWFQCNSHLFVHSTGVVGGDPVFPMSCFIDHLFESSDTSAKQITRDTEN